jgi:uncharacterized LabA/DUF88 family protein
MDSKNKKVYAFIDSQNLNLGILGLGWKLDFARFRVYLRDKYKVSKAFLFIGYIDKNQRMYDSLKKYGYKLIFKPTIISKHETKGNVDAELVLHSMIQFGNYDRAVIVSGDGDFHCLIEYLLQQSKLEGVVIPNKYKFSALLREFSLYLNFMNLQMTNLGQKKRGIILKHKVKG